MSIVRVQIEEMVSFSLNQPPELFLVSQLSNAPGPAVWLCTAMEGLVGTRFTKEMEL